MKTSFNVVVSWPVFKTYEVDAETQEEAVEKVRKMVDSGEVCVWTDGYETRDGADPTIEVEET